MFWPIVYALKMIWAEEENERFKLEKLITSSECKTIEFFTMKNFSYIGIQCLLYCRFLMTRNLMVNLSCKDHVMIDPFLQKIKRPGFKELCKWVREVSAV